MTDIRLIATDMDGTLLNSKSELDASFFTLFSQLRAQGILFAAASGRQYYNLAKYFDAVKDDMFFVAENGSYVMHRGEEVYVQSLELSIARQMIEIARTIPNTYIILCGKKKAYVESNVPKFWDQVTRHFEQYQLVEDLTTIEDDQCLKVSLCDFDGSANNSYPYFQPWEQELQVKVSGGKWLDISHKLANKGQALKVLQERYGITPEQTMAFGDYLNDLEMMQQVHHSYAMENAHPAIKEAARFQAKSNDEKGVFEVLNELITCLI
jgi:Cof subfamily protein (haloacid dehalogenase superfamily)